MFGSKGYIARPCWPGRLRDTLSAGPKWSGYVFLAAAPYPTAHGDSRKGKAPIVIATMTYCIRFWFSSVGWLDRPRQPIKSTVYLVDEFPLRGEPILLNCNNSTLLDQPAVAPKRFREHVFASANFFLFSREAKFGDFRPARLLQVGCWLAVSKWP
jgi:hypothetical protein